jgi:ribosomal protein S18 acetylase RimI-like enzyme
MPPTCEFLPWDTEFFGIRIARIHGAIARDDMPVIEDWCAKESIRCAYLLTGSGDAETIRVAEDHHFHLTDLRLTLERRLSAGMEMPTCVRPARENDIPELVNMARVNHTDSRFYYDPGFPRERCDALYATWAEKSCRGWADAVFVAEQDGRTAGYITCHDDKSSGRIGLVGVAGWARGGGLGRELLQASLSFFASRNLPSVTVVTQLRNVGAQRLYQRNGFVARSLELWYHRWF